MVDYKKIKQRLNAEAEHEKRELAKYKERELAKKSTSEIDLTVPREWLILSYNPYTDDYLLTTMVAQNKIVSCLKCDIKLEIGSSYKGYKDISNRKLVVISDKHIFVNILNKINETDFRNESTLDNIEKAFNVLLSASNIFMKEIKNLFDISKKEYNTPCVVVLPGKKKGLDAMPADFEALAKMTNYQFVGDYKEKLDTGFIPVFLFSLDVEALMSGESVPEDYQNRAIYLKSI